MRVVNVVDTKAPRVDLLDVFEVNLPRWREYIDPPIALVDNYNTDKQMRDANLLISINSLPLNTEKKPFGDVEGLYSVTYKVKDLSGNESKEEIRTINVVPSVGVNNVLNLDGMISIYPNPSNGKINLRLASIQNENVKILIYDMLGKVIEGMEINGNNLQANELDLSAQPKGIYLIKVQTSKKTSVQKIQIN
jgi:hypothetical protein